MKFVFFLFFFCVVSTKTSAKNSSESILAQNLLDPTVYDRRVRPLMGTGLPVKVNITIYILELSSINENNMDYMVSMYFRRHWFDERLMYDSNITKKLSIGYMVDKIWQPDIYFENEKTGHDHIITVPNILLMIRPEGAVVLSQKLTLKLSCIFHLYLYPLDTQNCTVSFLSYGYPSTELQLQWNDVAPFDFKEEQENPEFDIDKNPAILNCTKDFSVTGSFSCLFAEITLRRKITYFVIQIYIPNVLIVILSWVSFWIDHHATPARVSLGVLTVLTVTTQSSNYISKTPRVSYVKAIDVWQSGCLIFVFAAFIEFALVNVLQRKPGSFRTSHLWQRPLQAIHKRRSQAHLEDIELGPSTESEEMPSKSEKATPKNAFELIVQPKLANGADLPADQRRFSVVDDSSRLRNRIGPLSTDVTDVQVTSSIENEDRRSSNVSESESCRERTRDILTLRFICPRKSSPSHRPMNDAEFVDFLSRYIFPLAFSIFNFIYWVCYIYPSRW